MIDLPLEYWNKLANQILFISALLGGFSLAIIATLLVNKESNRITTNIFRSSALSSAFFLVTIFAMTKIVLMTTPGFPFEVKSGDMIVPRILGTIAFFLGIVSLIVIIALSGWTKSKRMGRFTTILGGIALILILLMLT